MFTRLHMAAFFSGQTLQVSRKIAMASSWIPSSKASHSPKERTSSPCHLHINPRETLIGPIGVRWTSHYMGLYVCPSSSRQHKAQVNFLKLTYNVLFAPRVQVCDSSVLHISQNSPYHITSPMFITQPPSPYPLHPRRPQFVLWD